LINDGVLNLTYSAVKCAFIDSKPDGKTNQAIGEKFLTKFLVSNPKDKIKKSVTFAGGDLESQATGAAAKTTSTQAGPSSSSTSGGGSGGKCPKSEAELKVDLDDPAIQHACAMMLSDDETSWVFSMDPESK
jgi:hypothetical protein